MLRYLAVSTAAEAISVNRATRATYRRLGDIVLQRMRMSSESRSPISTGHRRTSRACQR